MDERLFARLAQLIERGPVILASVCDTRGATPRRAGSRMLITEQSSEFSVGGGMAEVRVIDAARVLLQGDDDNADVSIDLRGGAGSAGVCGGTMQIVLRRWNGAEDLEQARKIATALQRGEHTVLRDPHRGTPEEVLYPNARLLIVGAGHCGLALYELAKSLDFELWVHDERADCFAHGAFGVAHRLCGAAGLLDQALQTQREVYAVLLNRDFAADVAALNVLCRQPPRFLGMMGSNRRIAEVLRALPQHRQALDSLRAPIGIEIGAQTPHEIAISILAQLVKERHGTAPSA